MTFEEMEHIMRSVKARWKNGFPNEVMERIFYHVRDLPPNELKNLCNAMLDTQRYAPLPKDFMEAARKIRARLGIESPGWPRPSKRNPECQWCADSGSVFIETKPGKNLPFITSVTRCDCKVGRNGPPHWGQVWGYQWEKNWVRLRMGYDFSKEDHGIDFSPNSKDSSQEKMNVMRVLKEGFEQERENKKSAMSGFRTFEQILFGARGGK